MSNLIFNNITPPLEGINGVLNLDSLGANAEISAYNPVSGILYTVGGGSGAIVVSDLTDPSNPRAVAVATPSDNSNTLQSVAVFGRLLAVAVQNPVKTEPGFVQFYDLTNPVLPVFLTDVTVGALPDMVKFNNDGTKLLVTNEGEPDNQYAIDPVGSISVIDTSAYLSSTPQAPTQANVQTIDFSPWEGRKEELINRGIRIGGRPDVTTTLAQDMEPEAIAITTDGNTAYISLQENNAIAVLDLSTDTPQITNIFSAGIQDWERGRPSADNFNYSLSYAMGDNNLPEGVLAGGLSGLWFDRVETINEQPLDVYYSITDRGPNGDLVDGKRQFLDPDFQPTIYKLGMNRGTGEITELDKIGLNRQDGAPLTGLPQLAVKDDIPIDSNNQDLPYDPFGIDSETVGVFTVTIEGVERKVFAVGDEYRGQIALFDFTTGNLIQRYIPAGQKALLQQQHGVVIGAETIDTLPAIYGNRWPNRGIEAMSFNSNNGLLYAFMQSPLDNINQEGRPSRSRSELIRILAIDPATGIPQTEHFYLLSGRTNQDKLGDAVFDPVKNVFYVIERDSNRNLNGLKHIYEVDLRGATNTLEITLTDGWTNLIGVAQPELLDNRRTLVDGVYSISTADTLAGAGIRLAHKVELFNLPSIGGTLAYDKPEGLALRDDGALVINYDNDFGTEGASGNSFTVVTFNSMGLDSSDRDGPNDTNIYRPLPGLKVYGLTMPDGLATYTDSQGRTFILAAGEGDSREYPPDEGNIFYDLTRANSSTPINNNSFRNHPGVELLNLSYDPDPGVRTRLNLLNNYGDITGDGLIDQAYTIGSRSLRIFDDKGNVVFDSGNALEELANSLGLMASNRDDDKGTEPEMVEVVTVNGRTHALVALERTTTSVAAVFDITDPYNVVAVDPIIFPDANRIEGIAFLTTPTGKLQGVIASSEGNDVVSVITDIDLIKEAVTVISGSPSADDLTLTSDQSGITVFTGDGDDQVDGSQAVSNAIYSGKGNDTILVGSDSNVSSGDGDDTLMIGAQSPASTSVLDGGRGEDTLIVVEADGPNILLGGADHDTLQVAEGRGQMLFGGDSRDVLRSSPDGHNRLYGGSGDDQLYSTVGDRLFGGDGNDSLYAGQGGNNLLWGGQGADNFWLVVGGSLPDLPNVLKDFELGIDRIGMGGITANQVSLLSQNGNTIIQVGSTDVALIEGVNIAQFNLNDSSQFVFA
ncbi:esterase-like activity of phytase family protein [Anabaenopsis tanganyikae CS-531]|uniref:Esterase-like activity of phytase family protein n=2 Tax=Anabaenopsis TaxID=110103 RepID=A0ABT6KHV7_9CYAN|nr:MULTISPECIES: esterase-like activity of phytase family protein [Anabaenopsis]MDB9540359.1 esterase-like activity of phytase family protein [Anabaenopsis arnoldii]MDH6092757.1 esterase-like activity of phytase family protein [Anabaenopsis arnoldii]MDH6107288.1 esterase-like activity of phytase family protein [Anabaenopsis tanganyikae CS-531]